VKNIFSSKIDKKNSLHISLTEFRNESRVLKEASSLVHNCVVDTVYIAALHAPGLSEDQDYGSHIHVHRFMLLTREYGKNLFIQIVKYLEYCLRVFLSYRKNRIQFVNVHSLGLLPLGWLLKVVHGAYLIYDAHELETETNGSGGIRKKLGKWLERWFIKYVDLTIVVSESIADWYETEYVIKRPTVVLNAPNRREFSRRNYLREQLSIGEDQRIFLYQGGLTKGRGVSLILDAFKVRKDTGVVVVFMGYGPLESDIRQASHERSNTYFIPAVLPDVVLDYTASADIGIHLIQNTCLNHDYCMPNKLFEYAMAGLPVIVSNMKEMREFVVSNQMGIVVESDTIESVNQAINRLLSMDFTKLKRNAKKAALAHSWEYQEDKMLVVYKKLLDSA